MSTAPVTLINGNPGALAASYQTTTLTAPANTRAIAFGCAYRNALLSKPAISDDHVAAGYADPGWTELGTVHTSNATNPDLQIVAWISNNLGPTPPTMRVTVTSTGAAGTTMPIITVLDADTDGTALQVATGEDLSAGDPSFTFANPPGANNIVVGCNWHGGGNAITKPANYTNMFDNTPTNLTARRVEVFYDNTSAAQGPNGSSSSNIRSVVLAIELGPHGAGGTTYFQTVNIGVTGTVATALAIGKLLAISGAGSVALVKAVSKTLAVGGTGAVKVLKTIGKGVSISGAGAVALAKSVGKILGVAGTGTVSLSAAKVFLVVLNISASGTVAVRRAVSKSVGIPVAGTVSAIKSIGKGLVVPAAGTVAVTRQVAKKVQVAVSGGVSVLKGVSKLLAVPVAGGVAVTKGLSVTLNATVQGTVTLQKAISITLRLAGSAAVQLVASIGGQIGKVFKVFVGTWVAAPAKITMDDQQKTLTPRVYKDGQWS